MLTYYSFLHYYSAWRLLFARRLIHPLRLFLLPIQASLLRLRLRQQAHRRRTQQPPFPNLNQPQLVQARRLQLQARRRELAIILNRPQRGIATGNTTRRSV